MINIYLKVECCTSVSLRRVISSDVEHKKVTSYQHLQVTCKLQLQVCKSLDCMGPHLFALALFVSLEGGSYHHLKPKKGQKKG